MGFSETVGDLSKELKFWQVSWESGSDLRQTVVFLGALLRLGTMHGVRLDGLAKWRGGARDGTGTVGGAGTLTAGSSRSRERNRECVKWDVNQHSGAFCMVLLLNEILQSP